MNIIEAVKLLLDGEKIRVNNWYRTKYLQRDAGNSYVVLNQLNEKYTIKLDDMLLDCWEIYEKQTNLYGFEEAIASLKKGKSIKRKAWINKFSVDVNDKEYVFSRDDLDAKDWIIMEEKIK